MKFLVSKVIDKLVVPDGFDFINKEVVQIDINCSHAGAVFLRCEIRAGLLWWIIGEAVAIDDEGYPL